MLNIGNRQLPTVMQHSFSRIPQARIPRTQFKTVHGHKTTFDVDYLIPFYIDEALPADTFNVQCQALVRLVTPLTPFMDNLYIDFFWFFIPNRLLWSNWVKMMGERFNPDDSIDYVTPYIDMPADTGIANQTLFDYAGVPTQIPDLRVRSLLFWRAYNLTWNEWFRDQNLQDRVHFDFDDGPDDPDDYVLLKRGKRHDYFTSCLPWPQKGTAIDMPIGTSAPIFSDGTSVEWNAGNVSDANMRVASSGANITLDSSPTSNSDIEFGTNTGIYADLTAATGATINALIESFAYQDLLTTDARGGTRYTELLQAHFGVTSPDSRLQRPEYLGGGSSPFMVNPLAQLSQTATTELGTLGATATSIPKTGFVKSFTEHGIVMGLCCVRADLTYQQGLARKYSRTTRYDYYWPALANLSEQPVYNKEIYAQGNPTDDEVFGYQERWAELRYGRSIITGKMRSNDAQSLDIWHLSEEFESLPALNDEFIQQNTPLDRVIAVENEPHFKADFYFNDNKVRPLPLYSVPGLLNRF